MGLDMSMLARYTPEGEMENFGYWRKAHAVHNWFVRECQGGVDECQLTPLTWEDIYQLRNVCQQVFDSTELVDGMVTNGYTLRRNEKGELVEEVLLRPGLTIKDSSVAERLLPTTSGFFFGSTDYDEGYVEDVQYTLNLTHKALSVLEENPNVEFFYQSSW